VSKKNCPLGEDCDLTLAWMMGAEDARDKTKAQIAELEANLENYALNCLEARGQADEAYHAQVSAEARLKMAVYLLTDAMVQLREGKIKTRRNRADIIEQVLEEWRNE